MREIRMHKPVVPIEFSQKLLEAEDIMRVTKRMRKILNEILVNTGYHSKNRDKQIDQLLRVDAPKAEIRMIKNAYVVFNEYSVEEQMKRFEELCVMLEDFKKQKEDTRMDACEA